MVTFRQRMRYEHIIALLWMVTSGANGTFTRVGNTYMKMPDSCCSVQPGEYEAGCDMTSLHATERVQLAYSPGFPNPFPIGRMCMWSVQCQAGYQVRLEFRDFYLIGPDKNGECTDQYVMVESPLTGLSMGRFCGNSGLPTIVTPGNLAVIKLFSQVPMSSESFRGFVFVFRETLEAPNPEMRPANWINHGQFSVSPRAIAMRLAKIKPTNIPSPNRKKKPTPKTKITSVPDGDMDEKSEDKEESSKNPNKNRKTKVPNFARPGINKRPNIYGENQNRDIKVTNRLKESSGLPLRLEIFIAIGVGGVCVLALFILIACKVNQVVTRKNQARSIQQHQINLQTFEKETEESKRNVGPCQSPPLEGALNKKFALPSVPAAESYAPTASNDLSLPPSYFSASGGHPYYSANASTLPAPGSSNPIPHPSNTLSAGLYPDHGMQKLDAYSLTQSTTPSNGNQMLLYDPNSGVFYQPPEAYHQPHPMSSLPQLGAELSFQNPAPPHHSDYDTTSESSWSSDYSEDRVKKSKSAKKKRQKRPSAPKRKKRKRRKRKR